MLFMSSMMFFYPFVVTRKIVQLLTVCCLTLALRIGSQMNWIDD